MRVLEAAAAKDHVFIRRRRCDDGRPTRQRVVKASRANTDRDTARNIFEQAANQRPPVTAFYAAIVNMNTDRIRGFLSWIDRVFEMECRLTFVRDLPDL